MNRTRLSSRIRAYLWRALRSCTGRIGSLQAGDALERFEPFTVQLPGHRSSVDSEVIYQMTRHDATTILRSNSVAVYKQIQHFPALRNPS